MSGDATQDMGDNGTDRSTALASETSVGRLPTFWRMSCARIRQSRAMRSRFISWAAKNSRRYCSDGSFSGDSISL